MSPLGVNVPNALTVLRIILTFIFLHFIFIPTFEAKLTAAVVFLIASATDYLDGYFARRYNLISDFGKIMDPIADKFLMLSAFVVFADMALVYWWMVVVILIREIGITIWRLIAMNKGQVLAAEKAGKIKTVVQVITVYFILIFIVLQASTLSLEWTQQVLQNWHLTVNILMAIVFFITLFSGISFLWHNRGSLYVR